jgi:hypothetical protein
MIIHKKNQRITKNQPFGGGIQEIIHNKDRELNLKSLFYLCYVHYNGD